MIAVVNNPRSRYKHGDLVVFTYAGPNFQKKATVEHVRKDGALVVIHEDGKTQVVQPYEIGPTGTAVRVGTGYLVAELEPWDGPAENPRGTGDLHQRIAAALHWPLRDVQSVSLQSLRDLVRPVSAKLADEISRVVQSTGHYVHTGVETSPTERQILDFMLVDAEDVDRGTFSRASTEEVAQHFKITPEVAYKRMNALAKRGVITKSRDILKGRGGKKAVGYQLWEYAWKPGDEAYADTIRRPAGNPLPTEHTEDEACTVGPDGTCTVCGVSHTGQCVCGGRGFHRPKCPQAERGEPIAGRGEPMTKPGPNGVLYRITVSFRDPGKPAFDGEEHWSTWAYSLEHANDLFREQHEGFKIVRTQLETETAENPRRAPSKRYGDIEWRWENEGNYRAFVGGQPTEWLGTRNDNEPPSSSLRWALLRGDEIEPYTELGSLEAISGALGRMLARGAITRENPNPRPKSHGFIVVDTRTGEILSDLFKRREGARDAVAAIVAEHGRTSPAAGDVEYKGGRWYRALGVHQVMLYPGQTYDRGTYKP